MFGWFKLTQEVTRDLQTAARIILRQNPNSLEWAKNRFWEFSEILVNKHGLVPIRSANGFGAVNAYNNDELVFFDNYYAIDRDPYNIGVSSLRLSLQVCDGKRPFCFFEATQYLGLVENQGEENERTLMNGHIKLTGQCGKQWRVSVYLTCADKKMFAELAERFYDLFNMEDFEFNMGDCENQNGYFFTSFEVNISAHDARDLFREMAEYFRSKQEKPHSI